MGLFKFNVMPFDMQGAPATFQRLIDKVLDDANFATAYIDDIIIYRETCKDHLAHLIEVLSLDKQGLPQSQANVNLLEKKYCTFFRVRS